MNCTDRLRPHFRDGDGKTALWTVTGDSPSYGDVGRMAGATQVLLRDEGVRPGDAVLVLGTPSPVLFSAILGLLGSGVTVVFVEPWLPVAELDGVLDRVGPRVFLGSRLALLWALRVPGVRRIPRWIPLSRIRRTTRRGAFEPVAVDPDLPGTLTFTSGTTGVPRGLVRSHGCLDALFRLLGDDATREAQSGPDLCVFPNLALLHLASGRGTVLVPHDWSPRSLRRAARVARVARPTTLSCGPAFLELLIRHTDARPGTFRSLRQVAVGGAQVDCALLERGFGRWPGARWLQVYGGTEAEPVAKTDARESVRASRQRGHHQALFLGRPIPELDTDPARDGLWVCGPNVARPFGGSEGHPGRRRDPAGREWHFMGDRIDVDARGWWYRGRSTQPREEFDLEQRLYAELGTSACFVHRDADGRLRLYGEELPARARDFTAGFRRAHPELDGVRPLRIVRDRRHRARIDRTASLRRGGYVHG